nr:MarR family transcriptional regulator [Burkholderiaceae bacterium]
RFIAPMYRTRHDLKIWEWWALAVIAPFEPLSAKELAEHSSSDPINVARAIRSLTGKALISRTAAAHDRRRAVLTLTEAGRAVHADVERTALRVEQILRETMTDAERATFARALDLIDGRIAERLQRMEWREVVDDGGSVMSNDARPPRRAAR